MIFYLFQIAASCDIDQKYWCDSFNSEESCYSHIDCDSYGDPIVVPQGIIDKFEISMGELLNNSACDFEMFKECDDDDWDEYIVCVESANCGMLLRPEFISSLPEDVWIAVKARGLQEYPPDSEELYQYTIFQTCIGSCEDLCAASKDEDRECVENCILSFCV